MTYDQRLNFIIGKRAQPVKLPRRVPSATITIFLNNLEGLLYRHLEHRLAQQIRDFLRRSYDLDLPKIVIEQPPRVELGEYALPLAFELAKKLRKPPRKIAEEIVAGIGPIDGFERLELAGAGYINARVKRERLATALAADENPKTDVPAGKVLVEHSSINPNKAAHIGHLRNAILGDTFVRLLRFAGREVDVQNYIDNTGVQVADVIVGFLYLEKQSRAAIEELTRQPRFDYYCWDLYAQVSRWYEQDKQNRDARQQVLHALEEGGNETAAIADLISIAVLRRHLETMDRLDIEYDFLPRESEILHLHFWDAAFTKLKDAGVLSFEAEGKNKGCWVMRRGKPPTAGDVQNAEVAEADQKVIVRSNGTVGYVGKDIAYHLWKFGLLGRDFGYRKFGRSGRSGAAARRHVHGGVADRRRQVHAGEDGVRADRRRSVVLATAAIALMAFVRRERVMGGSVGRKAARSATMPARRTARRWIGTTFSSGCSSVPLILSLTVHEWAHAYSAFRLGDDTAARMGAAHPQPHPPHRPARHAILCPCSASPSAGPSPCPSTPRASGATSPCAPA